MAHESKIARIVTLTSMLLACGSSAAPTATALGDYERTDVETLPITAPGEVQMMGVACDVGATVTGGSCTIDARGAVADSIAGTHEWTCAYTVHEDGAHAAATVRCSP